jgi:hypothetical protein
LGFSRKIEGCFATASRRKSWKTYKPLLPNLGKLRRIYTSRDQPSGTNGHLTPATSVRKASFKGKKSWSNSETILVRRTTDVLGAALDYIASITRWSGNADRIYMTQGTLWYGTMCRSFLLLDRMLRLSLIEVSTVANSEIERASKSSASGKPVSQMTFGQ